ncbi:MAG: NADH-quinone oxidoreductase subunit NuoH [Anaerolineae bacterium]|nr:NADH-quinone oxidoreductase subunit NuoH [Anaerolineae bacterium]
MKLNRRIITIIAVVALIGLAVTVALGVWLFQNYQIVWGWLQSSNDPSKIIQCSDSSACKIAHPITYGLIFIVIYLTGFAYTTLLERKVLAFLQQRVGPNRVGPGGFLQPAADAVKLIFKEDVIPDQVDKPVFYLAPMLKVIPALIVVAVIPLGPDILFPWFDGNWYQIALGFSDVNVGVLWILGITSLGTYGVVLAGWSSNNKYAMLGGLRATAQMISYELSMGLTIAVPVMIAGSMSIGKIINMQTNPWDWLIFQNPLAGAILILALFAEVSRAPFDLVEAEQELTAGFMTEYSGMKFAMFMMAEYLGMIAVSMIAVSLFFGGYHFFFVNELPLLGPLVMIGKIVIFLAFFIWARGTLPRVRYDRLMSLGWKVLLPLSLVSVAWTAFAVVLRQTSLTLYIGVSALFFVVVLVGGWYFLSAENDDDVEEEYDMANDPLITGERSGWVWIGLNLLGGLIAIPFAMVNGLINGLESFGAATETPSDETAIVPSDPGGD